MGKYDLLEQYLANSNKEEITLTFTEIEKIMESSLPASATKYTAWWANIGERAGSHSQAFAWHNAGYKARVNCREKKVLFSKGNIDIPKSKRTLHRVIPKQKISIVQIEENNPMTVCGYPFRFIQQLIPACNNDEVIKYYPQKDYHNTANLPLLHHGKGAFCRFSINAPAVAGVYIWVVENEIIYIGETSNLATRFNRGYGSISPRNCFVGGQSTNCKMNKVVMEYYERHTPVNLYFYETKHYKQVELELLCHCHTKYNVKDN